MTRWLVQKNLQGHQDYVVQIAEACKKTGNLFHAFDYVPFSGEFPETLPLEGPTVMYAATSPVHLAWKRKLCHPGVFYNDNFRYSKYLEMLGDRMINGGPCTRIVTLKELFEEVKDCKIGRDVFIRPDKDLKEFTGEVVNTRDLAEWIDRIDRTDTLLKTDCQVIVSEPVGISTEWRLFIVAGEVITGSQYRKGGRLSVGSYTELPDKVAQFAKEVIQQWMPCPVCATDIGQSGENLYVVEFNCMNSSGFYGSNVVRLVSRISEHVEGMYNALLQSSPDL